MTLRANYLDLASEAMQILMKQEGYLREQFSVSEMVIIPVWELVKLKGTRRYRAGPSARAIG